MTVAMGIVVLYVGIIAANCRVFKRLHGRDEEVAYMIKDELALAGRISYQKTGS